MLTSETTSNSVQPRTSRVIRLRPVLGLTPMARQRRSRWDFPRVKLMQFYGRARAAHARARAIDLALYECAIDPDRVFPFPPTRKLIWINIEKLGETT